MAVRKAKSEANQKPPPVQPVVRLRDGIVPDDAGGATPLQPILNRYKPVGTTADVDFKTTRPRHATVRSHIGLVVLDNLVWEASAAFRLEPSGAVSFYARNHHLGLTIPYDYMGIDHAYEPDFLVRLKDGATVVLEIKGFEDDQTRETQGTNILATPIMRRSQRHSRQDDLPTT